MISPPFGGVYHLPVAALEQREPTRYGLRVKHPYFGGWLLIPCEGERAAGEVARTLDELARGALEPAVRAGVSAPPEGSRLRLERDYPDELVLSWPLIRAEKVGFSWLFALAMLPLCGAGLLLVPGLLLRERCRNRLRLSPERLALAISRLGDRADAVCATLETLADALGAP